METARLIRYTTQASELNANSGLVFQNVTYGDSYLLAGHRTARLGHGDLINTHNGAMEISTPPTTHGITIR